MTTVDEALDPNKHPAMAEQLFYLFKAMAGDEKEITDPLKAAHPFYGKQSALRYINQLEELGAVERVTGRGRGNPIIGLKLLKEDISIPLGKRGRKSGEKPQTREEQPPSPTPVRIAERDKEKSDIEALETIESLLKSTGLDEQATANKRAVVFIDENELIRADEDGIDFDIDKTIEKIGLAGYEIAKVFVYVSEETEKQHLFTARRLWQNEDQRLRYIKTANGQDAADKCIKEDIFTWLQNSAIGAIVLSTADGGPDFLEAIEAIKKAGKKFVLLKAASTFNKTLVGLSDEAINATPPNPRRNSFREIVEAANYGNFYSQDKNSRFVQEVARGISSFFATAKEGRFMQIVEHACKRIGNDPEFKAYVLDDVREALTALVKTGQALIWRRNGGSTLYHQWNSGWGRMMRTLLAS